MTVEIKVPYLGHNVPKATVVRWLKQVGDDLKTAESVVELEAEKAVIAIESPTDGTLLEIVASEGTVVKTEDLLGIAARLGENASEKLPAAVASPNPEVPPPSLSPAERNFPRRVVVIGGGPGGYSTAIKAAQKGATVTLIEKDKLGGTCLNTGCMPTKSYLNKADILARLAASPVFRGIQNAAIDMPQLVASTCRAVDDLVQGIRLLMERYRIETVKGTAALTGFRKVSVQPDDDKRYSMEADAVVIASGSVPMDIPGVEVNGHRVHNTDTIWKLDYVPQRILIAGTGAVGVEFACIFSALGSQVTLVEILEQAMPGMDMEMADALSQALRQRGVELLTSTRILEAIDSESAVAATIGNSESHQTRKFDSVLIAAGRRPAVEDLGLANADVRTEGGTIVVGPDMQTDSPGIYAVGDVVGQPMLAHAAFHEADVAVANIFGADWRVDYRRIPYCVYSYPEVASIGLTEEKARAVVPRCKTVRFPFAANGKAKVSGEADGKVKIIYDEDLGEILGAHIIGAHATELIATLATAVSAELSIDEVATVVMAHPTLSEAMAEAAQMALGHAIHI